MKEMHAATSGDRSADDPVADRFSYFMVRVQQRDGEAALAGVVEQLSTGEKAAFGNAEMLLQMIREFLAVRP